MESVKLTRFRVRARSLARVSYFRLWDPKFAAHPRRDNHEARNILFHLCVLVDRTHECTSQTIDRIHAVSICTNSEAQLISLCNIGRANLATNFKDSFTEGTANSSLSKSSCAQCLKMMLYTDLFIYFLLLLLRKRVLNF